jgi:hypothetical protein
MVINIIIFWNVTLMFTDVSEERNASILSSGHTLLLA